MLHWSECTTDEEKRELIKEAVNEFYPVPKDDEGELFYRTVVVLVAAMWEGPDITRLSDLTGYSSEFVADIAVNSRKARLLIEDGGCNEHWFDGDFMKPIDIMLDVLVAQGKFVREMHDDGKYHYYLVRPC